MRFAQQRDAAKPLEGGLPGFLEKYVGACDGFFDGGKCRAEAEKFRAEAAGQEFWAVVREGETDMVEMGAYDPRTGGWILRITPAFPGGRHLLSLGAPLRYEEDGSPVFRALEIPVPPDLKMTPMDVRRMLEAKAVRLQLVFSPGEVWVAEQGGKKRYGVQATLRALLVTLGTSGRKLTTWFAEPEAKGPPRAKAAKAPQKRR